MNYTGEPYRATRLWLEAVAIFRKEVPLGKHRRQWKSYEESFIAQDAISWFQTSLQNKFEPTITRKQTLQLLRKFYKAGIFTAVNSSGVSSSPNLLSSVAREADFKDNGQLYRLVGWDPKEEGTLRLKHSNATPESKTIERKIPKFNVLINQLSNEQVNSIWEQAFVDRLASVIGMDVVRAFFKPHIIKGCWISHNLTQLGKYGVVLPAGPNDDLPSWLVSAMKCLANWPSHHTADPGIPNYPNFERDVFKLISEYFSMYKGGVPLLTFDLYDAFIMSFIRAELFDFNSRLYSAKTRGSGAGDTTTTRPRFYNHFPAITLGNNQSRIGGGGNTPLGPTSAKNNCVREEPYPFNASESIENLIMDILTPGTRTGRNNSRVIGNLKKQLKPKNLSLSSIFGGSPNSSSAQKPEASGSNVVLPTPKPMEAQSYDIARYLPGAFFYETAFTVGSPITRVMSKTELKSSFTSLPRMPARPTTIANPPEGASEEDYAYENPLLELSCSDMINHPKYSRVLNANIQSVASPSELCSSYSFENYGTASRNRNPSGRSSVDIIVNNSLTLEPSTASLQYKDRRIGNKSGLGYARSQSATHLSDLGTDRSPYFPERSTSSGLRGLQAAELADFANSSSKRTLDFYYGADACIPGLMTTAGKQMAIQSFRLLTLLLPPTSRRHLQLLLRCMAKMAKNEKLKLASDKAKPTRAIVINTFFRCIMYCGEEKEFDELLALRIVTFMMDNDSEIFCVKEEEGIARGVHELISAQQIIKVPVEEMEAMKTSAKVSEPNEIFAEKGEALVENKENIQFCSRITRNEYEDQRLLGETSKSLRNLLDSIVGDSKMDEKDRGKRLKQFKEEYPHIYREKFDEENISFGSENNSKCSSKTSAKKEKKRFGLFRALRF